MSIGIRDHVGSKYIRRIYSCIEQGVSIDVDVYAVLEAFKVTCPARQHAIKKLLCAGLRNKGSEVQDVEEAIEASGQRAIELQRIREGWKEGEPPDTSMPNTSHP